MNEIIPMKQQGSIRFLYSLVHHFHFVLLLCEANVQWFSPSSSCIRWPLALIITVWFKVGMVVIFAAVVFKLLWAIFGSVATESKRQNKGKNLQKELIDDTN